MKPTVSVIIPIYRVEKYVKRCAKSLFTQDLTENVEFIFVDDASPDRSVEKVEQLLDEFPQRKPQTRIIRHKVNKGLPDARNTGLEFACGDYVLHVDSDDYIEPNMLSVMLSAVQKEDADVVWCDWFLSLEYNERRMYEPMLSTPHEIVSTMLAGGMKFNVWNKLVRRSLYTDNNISFPSGNGMGEDMTMILLCAHAKKVKHICETLYHYVKTNSGAFSQTYSDAHLTQLKNNVEWVAEYLTDHFGSEYVPMLPFLQLEVKFPFLLMPDNKYLKLWTEWYPEANRMIFKNNQISLRSRIVQWCASHRLWLFVKAYRYLLNRIVYGKK